MFKSPKQAYTAECKEQAVTRVTAVGRMSRKENGWDHAPTESWFNSVKNERVYGIRYATHAEMMAVSVEDMEGCYNRTRRHSTRGDQSPMPCLEEWCLAQHEESLAA